MTSFAKRLEHLSSPEKRALLRQLLQQKLQRNGRETLSAGELFQIFDSFVVNVTQLSAEAVLDPTIRCDDTSVTPPTQAANVLLTGATGFLGAFLLHELLDQTGAAITCLVRAPDGETGKQRLLANLRRYLPETKVNEARIAVIPGDLAQPLLGLSPQDFAALAERIDVIYHNGAMVNWLYPYARLKPANVQGTQEVIRLAAQTRRKPLHYVSSLSVFPLVGNRELVTLYEETPLDHGGVLYGGYTQSKWVAEKLVAAAGSRGLPTAIYRPSLIIGHSQTGIWNSDDVVSRMLKSWVELNAAPDVDITLDMVPVDYVGGAIVHLSMCRGAAGDIYHLGNSHPVTAHDLTAWLTAGGYPLRSLPYKPGGTR
jgi:thioester reductase-like protein